METQKEEEVRKYPTNSFYLLANEYRIRMTDEEDINKNNMTEQLYQELEQYIKHGELINIIINGRVRQGKTTMGMAIGAHIHDNLLPKYKYNTKRNKFGLKNIARDQQEYSLLMRDPKTQYTVILTDESNELEKGGENATAEAALTKVFDTVHAGRYVHCISICPNEVVKEGADIILEVTSMDEQTMTTLANLYYRSWHAGNEHRQLLGYVEVNVSPIIKKWMEVKPHYYKPHQTKEDKKVIEQARKEDWYVEYIIKKHEKMSLITTEGILRPRSLDYAEVTLAVVEKLKKLTKRDEHTVNLNMTKNYVKMIMTQKKIPHSLIGIKTATEDAQGVLDFYKQYHKTRRELNRLEKLYRASKISDETYEIEKSELQEQKDESLTGAKEQESTLEKYKRINQKYKEHLQK